MREYEIKTIDDFLKVPADRLEQCLKEFKMWCELTRPLESAVLGIAHALMTEEMQLQFKRGFTWIDDGEYNVKVRIE